MDKFPDSKTFKALGEPNRCRIIQILLKQRYCVGGLARCLGISEPSVSQHIRILREAGLLEGVKVGYYVHYSVNKGALRDMADTLNRMADSEYPAEESEIIRIQSCDCRCGGDCGTKD